MTDKTTQEPVAYRCRHSADEPWFFSDKPGYWEWQPLYAEQPAPVALTMVDVMSAMQQTRGFPMLTSNHCHTLAEALNKICLDKVKELNQ